jgi:hypothetical protein
MQLLIGQAHRLLFGERIHAPLALPTVDAPEQRIQAALARLRFD